MFRPELNMKLQSDKARNWLRKSSKLMLIVLLAIPSKNASSQTQKVYSSAEVELMLQKLNKSAGVLYFAAHPDDENNRLLTFLGRGLTLRTAYLALNRGEGGQNLIGDEQGDALGLIRTNELLGARSIDGARQFFTRAYDFGYSKNPAETFRSWNRDSVLSDAVWVIRLFRPDLIIDRFPTTGEGGHGHHTASAIISLDAMAAAADSTKFPEQLKTVKTWKVKRLFWNTFNFGGMNTTSDDQFKINVGGYSSVLGKSYGEMAAEGRSFHKSQGFGSAAVRGNEYEYLKLIKGEVFKNNMFEGIDTGLSRIAGAGELSKYAARALKEFNARKPELILPDLIAAYKSLDLLQDKFWIKEKKEELTMLIQACTGLWLSASTSEGEWSERSLIPLNLSLICRNNVQARLVRITLNETAINDASISKLLPVNEMIKIQSAIQADSSMITQPYWLKKAHLSGGYNLSGLGSYRSYAINPAPVKARFTIEFSGVSVEFTTALQYHSVNPASGESYQPLRILPPVSIRPKENLLVFNQSRAKEVTIQLTAFEDKLHGTLIMHLPAGYGAKTKTLPFEFLHKGEKAELHFYVNHLANARPVDSITFSAKIGDLQVGETVHDLEYSHIPHISWLSPSVIKVISPELIIPAANIAYIAGAGDQVPAVLLQLGYRVSMLSDKQALEENLSNFTAVITGVRAYNTRSILRDIQARLIDYVKKGGCLIQQYNRPADLVTENLGPYPFQISARRITDENAPVVFTQPGSSLLNFPNKITAADFNGWVQERAIYTAVNADGHYSSPISMNDPNEPLLANTLLFTRYGKGAYIYTGLVFFRELPAGVPGAIRLFVNMIHAARTTVHEAQ